MRGQASAKGDVERLGEGHTATTSLLMTSLFAFHIAYDADIEVAAVIGPTQMLMATDHQPQHHADHQ
jgi:hypothetical protein